jgi:hypothetical protein
VARARALRALGSSVAASAPAAGKGATAQAWAWQTLPRRWPRPRRRHDSVRRGPWRGAQAFPGSGAPRRAHNRRQARRDSQSVSQRARAPPSSPASKLASPESSFTVVSSRQSSLLPFHFLLLPRRGTHGGPPRPAPAEPSLARQCSVGQPRWPGAAHGPRPARRDGQSRPARPDLSVQPWSQQPPRGAARCPAQQRRDRPSPTRPELASRRPLKLHESSPVLSARCSSSSHTRILARRVGQHASTPTHGPCTTRFAEPRALQP